jgi:Phosphotransferase system cellobiose-specific component IIB
MNILLACSGGMSSSILSNALNKEARKRGKELSVDSTGTESVGDSLDRKKYDLVLLAPQVSFRKEDVEKAAKERGTGMLLIPRLLYNPLGAPKLLDLISEQLEQ